LKILSVTDIVAGILEKHEKWVETSALVKMIAKERNVSERQAYRDLKKTWGAKKIRKNELPDGVVLNGLSDWPFPDVSSGEQKETLTLQDAFKYQCFKKLDAAGKLSDGGNPILALNRLSRLVNMLPPHQREKSFSGTRSSF